jgi:hypothetical protein
MSFLNMKLILVKGLPWLVNGLLTIYNNAPLLRITRKSMKQFRLVFLIMSTPPLATLLQLIENILHFNKGACVAIHLGNQYDYNETEEAIKKHFFSNSSIQIIPEQFPTAHGKITYALLNSIAYINSLMDYEYLVLLPFNCLQMKGGIAGYLNEKNKDIYLDARVEAYPNITIIRNEKAKWNTATYFWESRISQLILRRYYNGINYFGGNFEGIAMRKNVAMHFNRFKWIFWLVKNRYSYLFEEIFFPTVLMELSKRHRYSIEPSQLCFVDWEMDSWVLNAEKNTYDHIVIEGTEERIDKKLNENKGSFFYKWVSTKPGDKNRLSLLSKSLSKTSD